jgi:hypothetical protein
MQPFRSGQRSVSATRFLSLLLVVTWLAASGCGGDADEQSSSEPLAATESQFVQSHTGDNHFVTSQACRDCHRKQFDSWHSTYHRTMTQEPTASAIQGQFDGSEHLVNGFPSTPFQKDGRFFITLVDAQWEQFQRETGREPRNVSDPPLVTYPVDRVIGSHQQQVYLTELPDGSFQTLPLVWHIGHGRWITRGSSFLSPSTGSLYDKTKLWNNGCIFCHNTGPRPRLLQRQTPHGDQYSWESRVAEFGIACEACHGAGAAHVEQQQRLADSGRKPDKQSGDRLIVNPTRLDKEQAVLVCSRCHGKMIARQEFDRECLVNGDFFEAGDRDYPDRYDHPWLDRDAEYREEQEGKYFWSNGTPRTTALEYQGLLLSPCYQNGELTCLSCHSMHNMHNGDPDDQLRFADDPTLDISQQNQACTQCHESFASDEQLARHSHHAPQSSGSLCFNCHMPFQTYALQKRVRSHRITIPDTDVTEQHGVPNACNQCHVDTPLNWAKQTLAEWSGNLAPDTDSKAPREASATVLHALSGHALQRALAIAQLGADETLQTASVDWRARILIEGLKDDYASARLLAWQSLRKLPGFDDFEFDFIGSPFDRQEQISDAVRRLRETDSAATSQNLMTVTGAASVDAVEDRIQQLVRRRNSARIDVLE